MEVKFFRNDDSKGLRDRVRAESSLYTLSDGRNHDGSKKTVLQC